MQQVKGRSPLAHSVSLSSLMQSEDGKIKLYKDRYRFTAATRRRYTACVANERLSHFRSDEVVAGVSKLITD